MYESFDSPAREFRIAAQYRRCGWYVLFGLILLIGVAIWVRVVLGRPFQAGNDVIPIVFLVPIIGGSLALLVGVYRWRLRIDERGISRRRFRTWDLWSWDEFESGGIRRKGKSFVSIARPVWNDTLTFEF